MSGDPYTIFIASSQSVDDVAESIAKILNVSIRFHKKSDDESTYYFEDYLDHRLTLNLSYGYLDIEEDGLMFNKYQYQLDIYFYTEPPTQDYLRMSEAERRVDSSIRYSEKYDLLLKVAKFTFENLKSSRQFSLMMVWAMQEKIDEFILNDSYCKENQSSEF